LTLQERQELVALAIVLVLVGLALLDQVVKLEEHGQACEEFHVR
jgi:hypothetical protein